MENYILVRSGKKILGCRYDIDKEPIGRVINYIDVIQDWEEIQKKRIAYGEMSLLKSGEAVLENDEETFFISTVEDNKCHPLVLLCHHLYLHNYLNSIQLKELIKYIKDGKTEERFYAKYLLSSIKFNESDIEDKKYQNHIKRTLFRDCLRFLFNYGDNLRGYHNYINKYCSISRDELSQIKDIQKKKEL